MEIPVETVAQAYLELLRSRGIKYIFGNSGTDFAPIIDGLAKFIVEKKDTPRPITVTHENVAVNMAMGYAMVTGEPQVVMAHVIVGAANASCALMNAYRLEIPMLFSAGRTPVTEAGLPGSRNRPIHWGQESFDQGGLLREFTKWDYELRHPIQLETVVDRALEMTTAEPQGPIYLILPREILSQKIESVAIHPWRKPRGPILTYPDPALVGEAIKWLDAANNPLLIASRVGRNPASVNYLVSFAEAAGCPILTPNSPFINCPTNHPHYNGTDLRGFLEEADLIIIVDSDVPWLPNIHQPAPDAKVIHISRDPSYQAYPIRGFPIDLAITGDPGITLKLAAEQILASPATNSTKYISRREKIKEKHLELKRKFKSSAEGFRSHKPIHPLWLAFCLNQILDNETILLNEYTLDVSQMDFVLPQSYFSLSPAGGLGWSIGAGLGVKLALPNKTCIITLGDGAYIFNVPTACHYLSQIYELPLLIIIINNGTWGASKRTVFEQFPDGWAVTANQFPLCDLTPSPKFEAVVSAFGGHGEAVEEPGELLPALQRAIRRVREEKRQVVLNVICAGPGSQR